MAYIGKTPTVGNFQVCDAISVVNNQAAYTMQVGGVNVSPESANHMLVSLNGILQAPTSSFTVSGSTITFAANLVTGDVIDFIQILGNVLDLGVPSDSTVSLAKLTATGTKNSTTFLRGDNTFDTPPAGGIENITTYRMTTNFTMSSGTNQITSNWSAAGASLGTAVSNSSGTFSFPQTGYWKIEANFFLYRVGGASNYIGVRIGSTTNNSSYNDVLQHYTHINDFSNQHSFVYGTCIVDVTNISNDKIRISYESESANNVRLTGNNSLDSTYIRFIRLGDT